uniref:importin-4-like n=1 Tax=Erigeron canadensis TaxID=72917 RepID=UPI001CB9916C|nr:importin-4-like [Erigeron canadensis]
MAQSLELLLLQFLMPDNEARMQAENQIKRLARDPLVVPELIDHIRSAKLPHVRQLSAVILRKKITGHWPKLPDDIRQLVKQSLIESITTESSPAVRRASANAASIIAKYAVPGGEWPDLLPFVFQCGQSPQEDLRQVGLLLCSSLTETIGDSFQPYYADLQLLLLKCLQDELSDIRVSALKAVGAFLESTHDESQVVKFCELIPSILNFSRECLVSGDEDISIIAFEIFDELIESPAPLPGESIKYVVQFSLEVCSNTNMEISTRHQAIQIISWLAKYKSNSLKENSLIIPILQIMCQLLTEATNSDEDDDLSPDRAAAEVLDTMSLKLSKYVFPSVFEFASGNNRSFDPKLREASVMVLGLISEGCLELMKENIKPDLDIVLEALRDPEQVVRGAASYALGQFAKYLQPDIISHYERILPRILKSLHDPSDDVKEKTYYALAAFCENFGVDIIQFIDPLMGKLLDSLQNSPRTSQKACLSAIGSIASAAEKAFIPYAERVLELMKTFMMLRNDDDLLLRATATELMGIVAKIAGQERMEAILPPFIEAAVSGYWLGCSELREYTHGFFSNVTEILRDRVVQYLPHVVPLAFFSCNLDDEPSIHIDDSDEDEDVIGLGAISSDDEAQDDPRVGNISIRTKVVDEKAAATQSLGLFALHTKIAYAPYLEESVKIMVKHSIYFHGDVRLQAITGLQHILTAAHAFLQGQNEGTSKTKQLLGTVMTIYTKTLNEDDDKEVVAQACMSVAKITKDFEYVAIEPYIPQLVESTLILLQQKSACQQVESYSDSDKDDFGHDKMLMDAVTDLLSAFSKAMGSNFATSFATLYDALMEFAKGSRSPQDWTMVVACLAEVAQNMGSPVSDYIDPVMPFVLKELASSSATNRRNAAFCVGELFKNGGNCGLKYLSDALHCLYPLLEESEPDHAVRDNAAGAIAKMIMTHRDSVPLNQVLPLLIKVLPIKEDREESAPVYNCICNLVLQSNSQILQLVSDLVMVFAQVAASPYETREVKLQIGAAISHLISLYGRKMQPILRNLQPTYARALAAIVPKS